MNLRDASLADLNASIRAIAAKHGTTEDTLKTWFLEHTREERYALTWAKAGFKFRSLACAFEREGHHDASTALLYAAGVVGLEDSLKSFENTQQRRAELIRLASSLDPVAIVELAPLVYDSPPCQLLAKGAKR